ncbi:hypothetical protein [Streptomyces sp. NBC_00620]|uniref:hypothetical protein n=1 Tax=Streptomyces sp. NBC_00620 TaxID=2903666 RepID=UPI00225BE96C|nr:hypothetical protein [Streptomyces sp. NBC_00620]MCX4974235.1 hypothetical protein [Streptomyces sp. NBC_00620]
MPEPTHTHADWQAEQHRTAQESAVAWAFKAEAAADDALRSEAYVTEHGASDYLRSRVAEERVNTQEHQARSTTARQLAEMWARVAAALTPGQAPANGEPATYDVHLDLGPDVAVGQEIKHQMDKLRQRPDPGSA